MNEQHLNRQFRPPRVSDFVLRLLLGRRRWESVAGDLLEEYREVALPARGALRARAWYWNQSSASPTRSISDYCLAFFLQVSLLSRTWLFPFGTGRLRLTPFSKSSAASSA